MADTVGAYAPGIAFVCGVPTHLHPGCRKHKTTLARYICMGNTAMPYCLTDATPGSLTGSVQRDICMRMLEV